jgi:hypothetical protein
VSRAITEEETKVMFLNHLKHLVDYWEREGKRKRDALTGLAHSILSTIDGCSMALPGFTLSPCPHENDRRHAIDNGYDWHESNQDIAGGLHELWPKCLRGELSVDCRTFSQFIEKSNS